MIEKTYCNIVQKNFYAKINENNIKRGSLPLQTAFDVSSTYTHFAMFKEKKM